MQKSNQKTIWNLSSIVKQKGKRVIIKVRWNLQRKWYFYFYKFLPFLEKNIKKETTDLKSLMNEIQNQINLTKQNSINEKLKVFFYIFSFTILGNFIHSLQSIISIYKRF